MLAIEQPSSDLQLAIDQVTIGADIVERDFAKPIEDLDVEEKDDRIRSEVAATDVLICNTVVGNIGRLLGEKTMAEEYKRILPELAELIAEYGTPDAWCLDPLDGTKNYLDAIRRRLGISIATVSLAKLIAGRPALGALASPLLIGPRRLYAAESGLGAFSEIDGVRQPLTIDTSQNEGIILVSETDYPSSDRIAQAKGLTILRLSGMALKMICPLDQSMIHAFAPGLTKSQQAVLARGLPILGFASHSAAIHDVAGGAAAGIEAGLLVTDVNGNPELPITEGEHGILGANNERNLGILVDAMSG